MNPLPNIVFNWISTPKHLKCTLWNKGGKTTLYYIHSSYMELGQQGRGRAPLLQIVKRTQYHPPLKHMNFAIFWHKKMTQTPHHHPRLGKKQMTVCAKIGCKCFSLDKYYCMYVLLTFLFWHLGSQQEGRLKFNLGYQKVHYSCRLA